MLEMKGNIMPRPCKRRCISALPKVQQFGPLNSDSNDIISMSVEEYEVIRLIDLEKLTQAMAAEKLGVSRTTVQAIYQKAREKIARALVEVKTIDINGGNYQIIKQFKCKKHKGECDCYENSCSK